MALFSPPWTYFESSNSTLGIDQVELGKDFCNLLLFLDLFG